MDKDKFIINTVKGYIVSREWHRWEPGELILQYSLDKKEAKVYTSFDKAERHACEVDGQVESY